MFGKQKYYSLDQQARIKVQIFGVASLILIPLILLACKKTESERKESPNSDATHYVGFQIGAISGNTNENGGSANFTLKLNIQPDGDVVIDLSSSDSTEGSVSSTPLTFTPVNWSDDQTVDVTGVDDNQLDGNQSYNIRLTINSGSTADTKGYAALDPDDVAVINVDNDDAFNLSQTGRFTSESGTSIDISVSLIYQPSFDVTIPISSSHPNEGSLSVNSLTFTAGNWDTSQDVTVTGEDDSSFDTAQIYTILFSAASSSDNRYDGYDPPDLTFYNLDDEYKLPDTGQTTRYSDTTGDDSDFSINPPSYTDNSDDTVTDNNTGLIWQRQDDNTTRNWAAAGPYCDGLTLGSQSDWRLPDKTELASIANYGTSNPAIDTTAFPGTKSLDYWSSTNYFSDTDYAWRMNFDSGYESNANKTSSDYHVRCVRSGPSSATLFADLGDQTVLDQKTGLVWQQPDDAIYRNWEEAISYCEGLSLAGKSDWRLPNARELGSIFDNNNTPAINTTAFPGALVSSSSKYYSSTTKANANADAWVGKFKLGQLYYVTKTPSYFGSYVRCVRSAQ